MQFAYKNTRIGVRSLVYSLIEQVKLNLLRWSVVGDALDRHISTYLNSVKVAAEVGGKLLSTSFFIALNAVFIHRRAVGAITAEHVANKMQVQMYDPLSEQADIHTTSKLVSPNSPTE